MSNFVEKNSARLKRGEDFYGPKMKLRELLPSAPASNALKEDEIPFRDNKKRRSWQDKGRENVELVDKFSGVWRMQRGIRR